MSSQEEAKLYAAVHLAASCGGLISIESTQLTSTWCIIEKLC